MNHEPETPAALGRPAAGGEGTGTPAGSPGESPGGSRAGGRAPLVGVLALQGDVSEHLEALRRAGAGTRPVRRPADLDGLDGLVLPGGESTTIGRLLVRSGLLEPVQQRAAAGRLAVYGTCAGLILLARDIVGSAQPRLGLMDLEVERNAYGRQVDSFEVDLPVPALGEEPVRAVFIRAPVVRQAGPAVEVLARWQGRPVLVRQGALLASTFHPELTGDLRIHRYFLQRVLPAAAGGGQDGAGTGHRRAG